MAATVDEVVAHRLRTQRLTAEPLADPADVVRLLTCVQAQDPALARFSVGMRTGECRDHVIRGAIDDGRILRTHILRPTWHFVAAEDLRWILALTSAKVESGMAARHRGLGLDSEAVSRTLLSLETLLAGRRCLTRRAISAELGQRGSPFTGEQLGHLLLVAELRGVVCSGPLEAGAHTYGLVEELVPPTPPRDRTDAVRDLVLRFFTGHGPAAVEDLTRWTKLTKTEVQLALQELDDRLHTLTVGGTELWFDPAADPADEAGPGTGRAFLLPVFDEVFLSYAKLSFPRVAAHPSSSTPHAFNEAGGGLVVFDRHDVGWWKRSNKGRRVEVTMALAPTLGVDARGRIVGEADRLAAFTGHTLDVRLV